MVVRRLWGTYEVLFKSSEFQVKLLTVDPRSETSMQRHKHRSETWIWPDGSSEFVPAGQWHQLKNGSSVPMKVIEVQTGDYFGEDDIERDPRKGLGNHIPHLQS